MRHVLLTILMLPLLCPAASSPPITLTDTNGVSATGKIITYSPNSGLIKIRQESSTATLSSSALTEESRRQISLWRSDKIFQSRSSMDVSFHQNHTQSVSNIVGTVTDRMTNKKTEQTIGHETKQFCTYKIKLTNESDTPFENLTADYRVFFTQQLTDEYTGKYQLAGRETLKTLAAGDSWNFSTTSFLYAISYRSAAGINWTGMPKSTGANIQGILLRVRKPGVDGEWIEHEIEQGEVPRNRDREDYQKVYK